MWPPWASIVVELGGIFFELFRLGIIIRASPNLVAAGLFERTIPLVHYWLYIRSHPYLLKTSSTDSALFQKETATVAHSLSCFEISSIDFITRKWDLSAVWDVCSSSSAPIFDFWKVEGLSRRSSPLLQPFFLCIKHPHPCCLGTLSFWKGSLAASRSP